MKYFIFIIAFLCIWGCRSTDDVTSNYPDASKTPNQEGWNSTLTTSKNGKISTRIKYTYVEIFSSQKLIKFKKGVVIDFYDSGVHVSKVFADSAILNESSNDIDLGGHVKVHSDDGIQLFTKKLSWNETRDKVLSDAFVTVVTAEKDTINGEGFKSEKSLQNWVIRKPWGVAQKKLNLYLKKSPE